MTGTCRGGGEREEEVERTVGGRREAWVANWDAEGQPEGDKPGCAAHVSHKPSVPALWHAAQTMEMLHVVHLCVGPDGGSGWVQAEQRGSVPAGAA